MWLVPTVYFISELDTIRYGNIITLCRNKPQDFQTWQKKACGHVIKREKKVDLLFLSFRDQLVYLTVDQFISLSILLLIILTSFSIVCTNELICSLILLIWKCQLSNLWNSYHKDCFVNLTLHSECEINWGPGVMGGNRCQLQDYCKGRFSLETVKCHTWKLGIFFILNNCCYWN